jgi:hypothetical protein
MLLDDCEVPLEDRPAPSSFGRRGVDFPEGGAVLLELERRQEVPGAPEKQGQDVAPIHCLFSLQLSIYIDSLLLPLPAVKTEDVYVKIKR